MSNTSQIFKRSKPRFDVVVKGTEREESRQRIRGGIDKLSRGKES